MKNEAQKIKAVFFDLGKVLLDFRHEEIVERLLARASDGGRKAPELFTYLFDRDDGLCNLYDEGRVGSREFYERLDGRFDLGVDYGGFKTSWNEIFVLNREVAALLAEVRKARPAYLLSNVNELHWEYIKGRFPEVAAMDGFVLSYEQKAKKPSSAIYEAAKRTAGVGRGESLFVDDIEENVSGAISCGIEAVRYTDAAGLRDFLSGRGVL